MLTATQQQKFKELYVCSTPLNMSDKIAKDASCPRCLCTLNTTDRIKLQYDNLIAGIIMIIPANLLPRISIYVNGSPSEIIYVRYRSFLDGQPLCAFVVFTASIFLFRLQ